MDFAMPGMNGAELARQIRKRRPDIAVVFVTGYADAQAIAGTDPQAILRKPYTCDELAQAVERSLNA